MLSLASVAYHRIKWLSKSRHQLLSQSVPLSVLHLESWSKAEAAHTRLFSRWICFLGTWKSNNMDCGVDYILCAILILQIDSEVLSKIPITHVLSECAVRATWWEHRNVSPALERAETTLPLPRTHPHASNRDSLARHRNIGYFCRSRQLDMFGIFPKTDVEHVHRLTGLGGYLLHDLLYL